MAGFPGGGPKAKAGLLDRSSRAHECHHALPAPVIERIVRLRRQRLTGAAIARTLGLVRSTVGLALRRLGLGRLSALEPKPAVVRYERAAPGQLIHLDIKKLGRVTRPGRAMKARGPGTHSGGGKGWDYLHGCADDASRLAYTEILPSENQHDVSGFLERALAWLARHGVKTERVMADNGAGYRSRRFAAGGRKAERFIQSSQRVSAYARPDQASEERSRSAIARTGAYNTTRPTPVSWTKSHTWAKFVRNFVPCSSGLGSIASTAAFAAARSPSLRKISAAHSRARAGSIPLGTMRLRAEPNTRLGALKRPANSSAVSGRPRSRAMKDQG